jgi:hypothetical protein
MATRNAKKEKAGSKAGMLLVLLLLLGGLCAWNYQRNAALESQLEGPYSTLSDADLASLLAAYQGELERVRAHGRPGRANARDTQGVASGVREFERVQRASRRDRDALYAVADREGIVKALEAEQSRRVAQGGGPWRVFLRRAFTF